MRYYTVHTKGPKDRAFRPAHPRAVTLEDAEDIRANLRKLGHTVSIVPIVAQAPKWEDGEDLDGEE